MTKPPCKDCKERNGLECKKTCQKWQRYREAREKELKAARDDADRRTAISEAMRRTTKKKG